MQIMLNNIVYIIYYSGTGSHFALTIFLNVIIAVIDVSKIHIV